MDLHYNYRQDLEVYDIHDFTIWNTAPYNICSYSGSHRSPPYSCTRAQLGNAVVGLNGESLPKWSLLMEALRDQKQLLPAACATPYFGHAEVAPSAIGPKEAM